MAIEHIIRWEPVPGIDRPCVDISFARVGRDGLSVTMHFSRTLDFPGQDRKAPRQGNSRKDLVIGFQGAVAARWEDESFGSLIQPLGAKDPNPVPLPRLQGDWERWGFPLLKVEDSSWLATYEARNPAATEGRVHFVLIAMNDLLHVIALPVVKTTWVEIPGA